MANSSFYGNNPTPTEYRDIDVLIADAEAAAATAETAGTGAAASAAAAASSATSAATSATSAATYASNASNSASNAADSAASAGDYANSAYNSSVAAANSASAASTSAATASSAASSALTSATAASNSASSAANSATIATDGATDANLWANNAKDWATFTTGSIITGEYSSKAWAIGGTGVTNSSSGGAAKEWAVKTTGTVNGTDYSAKYHAEQAATSASNASSSASAASTSASNAATNATNAANSASAASTSASNAASSASSASSSASSASSSATAATNAKNAAEAAYDNFDDRYLGAKASDPTVDNDGNPLITGALYFNTTSNQMRVYTGTAWDASYVPSSGYVQKTGDTMTGLLTLSGAPTASLHAATKKYVDDADALKANLASPALTGTPTAPTAAADTNTTQIATTAYVVGQGYVKKSGDTMTGALTLPSNGLTVGTNQLLVSGGNVGVGLSPSAKLDVANAAGRVARIGGVQISGTSTSADAGNNFISSGAYYNGSTITATQSTAAFLQLGNGALYVSTDSGLTAGNTYTASYRFLINSSGDVGIGTGISSPTERLHVAGGNVLVASSTSTGTAGYYIQNSATTQGLGLSYSYSATNAYIDYRAALTFRDSSSSNTPTVYITSAGNLGVGVSPTAKVHAYHGSGIAGYFERASGTGGALYGVSTGGIGVYGISDVSHAVYGVSATASGVYGASTEGGYGVRGFATNISTNAGIAGYFSTGNNAGGGTNTGQAIYANSIGGYGIDARTQSATSAGVIGFSSNIAIYGRLGASATYGVYSNGEMYSTGTTTLAGLLYNSGHGTTASAANVFINSTSGLISRSTSSLLYKKDVEPLWDSVGDKLLDAKPIFYRSNELTDDNTAWSWYSFGAEELGQLDPRFVLWGHEPKRDADGNIIFTYTLDEEGNQLKGPPEMEDEMSPNGIHTNAVLAAAINLIQRQHAKIEALEARVSALEGN